ncbi:MAG: SNF2-related protein [Leptospiraceae bacterium]|nr:SNF2-related protein [Leptospiraceae bacterium]
MKIQLESLFKKLPGLYPRALKLYFSNSVEKIEFVEEEFIIKFKKGVIVRFIPETKEHSCSHCETLDCINVLCAAILLEKEVLKEGKIPNQYLGDKPKVEKQYGSSYVELKKIPFHLRIEFDRLRIRLRVGTGRNAIFNLVPMLQSQLPEFMFVIDIVNKVSIVSLALKEIVSHPEYFALANRIHFEASGQFLVFGGFLETIGKIKRSSNLYFINLFLKQKEKFDLFKLFSEEEVTEFTALSYKDVLYSKFTNEKNFFLLSTYFNVSSMGHPMDYDEALKAKQTLNISEYTDNASLREKMKFGPIPYLMLIPRVLEIGLKIDIIFAFIYFLDSKNAEEKVSLSDLPRKEFAAFVGLEPENFTNREENRNLYDDMDDTGSVAERNYSKELALKMMVINFKPPIFGENLSISEKNIIPFFQETIPELLKKNVRVEMPEVLWNLLEKGRSSVLIMSTSGMEWFNGKVLIDGYTEEEVAEIIHAYRKGYHFHKTKSGKWVLVKNTNIDKVMVILEVLGLKLNSENEFEEATLGNIIHLDQFREFPMEKEDLSSKIGERLNQWFEFQEDSFSENLFPSEGFLGNLKEYQLKGFRFLRRQYLMNMGGVLADDMGLGKTIQTLAFLHANWKEDPSRLAIVVAPLSALSVWKEESRKFSPELPIHIWHGLYRNKMTIPRNGVIVTTFATFTKDVKRITLVPIDSIIVDEAQFIKNDDTQARRAIKGLCLKTVFCLSGTPLENNLGELWSIFDLTVPGLLGKKNKFEKTYGTSTDHPEPIAKLKKLISPFMLRRTRAAVLKELPEKIVQNLFIPMNKEQKIIYEKIRAEAEKAFQETSHSDFLKIVLPYLMRLRRIACHPYLFEAKTCDPLLSGKFEYLQNSLEELQSSSKGILVFSQFTDTLLVVSRILEKSNISYFYLDGSTTQKERASLVSEFQTNKVKFFLISLKAGGNALTLHKADTVIHLDPWWNPAVEEQATARAHRMGQTNNVIVYRLYSEGTLEEKVLMLQERKLALFNSLFEESMQDVGKITREDILTLIT